MVALGLPGPEMLKYELLYSVADGRTGAAPLFFLGKDGVGAAWLKGELGRWQSPWGLSPTASDHGTPAGLERYPGKLSSAG